MKPSNTHKNLEKILEVTKQYVKNGDKFNEYYHEKNNYFFINQLPLVSSSFKFKQNKTRLSSQRSYKLLKNFSCDSFNNLWKIRHSSVRPSSLPPLCPMYNDKGQLLSDVVKTSKISSINQYKSLFKSASTGMKKFKSLTRIVHKSKEIREMLSINSIKREIFNDVKYRELVYNEGEIFNKEIDWNVFVKDKVEELKKQGNENLTEMLEKKYLIEKGNSKITLRLSSLIVKFIPENGRQLRYNLPLSLLPLFYLKGSIAFNLLLTKLIKFKDDNFDSIEVDNKEIFTLLNKSNLYDPLKQIDLNSIREEKHNTKREKRGTIIIIDQKIKKTFNISPNNEYDKTIDPTFSHFHVNSIKWFTPKKIFNVEIWLPLVSFTFTDTNIEIRKSLDMEMMMFLYKNNFLFWDFYIINYLFTFKLFRRVIKKNLSHDKEISNIYYLSEINIKQQTQNSTSYEVIYTDKDNKNFYAMIEPLKYKIKYVNKDIFTEEEKEYWIKFNFDQMKKMLQIESSQLFNREQFILRFMKIEKDFSKVTFDYKAVNEFHVEEWVNEYKKYNRIISKYKSKNKMFEKKSTKREQKRITEIKNDEDNIYSYYKKEIVDGNIEFYEINNHGNLVKVKRRAISVIAEKKLQQSNFEQFINECFNQTIAM